MSLIVRSLKQAEKPVNNSCIRTQFDEKNNVTRYFFQSVCVEVFWGNRSFKIPSNKYSKAQPHSCVLDIEGSLKISKVGKINLKALSLENSKKPEGSVLFGCNFTEFEDWLGSMNSNGDWSI